MFSDAYSDCQAALPPGVMYFRDPCTDPQTGLPITEYVLNTHVQPSQPNVIAATAVQETSIMPMLAVAAGALLMMRG